MYNLETPTDDVDEYKIKQFVKEYLREICDDIAKRGEKTLYFEVYEKIAEYIEDNLECFMGGELGYDDSDL
jgi:hypothetical protein